MWRCCQAHGPLSDRVGRKPAVYVGYALNFAGALLSALAVSFPIMLVGRLMQGLGISAPRAITLALVRDRYRGRAMARVMSFVMTVFILVPTIAPALGQTILLFSGWRDIFGVFVLMGLVTLPWFALRVPETLAPEHRAPFSQRRAIFFVRWTESRQGMGMLLVVSRPSPDDARMGCRQGLGVDPGGRGIGLRQP